MQARRLRGEVTDDGRLVVRATRDLPPGEVEVIVLYAEPGPSRRPVTDINEHPAFGLWADRPEVEDAAAYSLELRHRLESRGDRRA